VVNHVEVGKVEVSFGELSHVLDAIKVVWVVDPGAFLVEDGGLQDTWREILSNSA
jgi:hypothetical protein